MASRRTPSTDSKSRTRAAAAPEPVAVPPAATTTAAAAPKAKKVAVAKPKEQRAPVARPVVTPDMRRGMIAKAAYLRAEKRGFAAGHENDDWIAAEAEVDKLLSADARAPQ